MNKVVWISIAVLYAFIVESQENDAGELGYINEEQKFQVSLLRLAGNPEAFDNKPVYISGYVNFEYGLKMYTDKNSCEDSFAANSVLISIENDRHMELAKTYENCSILSMYGIFEDTNNYGKYTPLTLRIGVLSGPVKIF